MQSFWSAGELCVYKLPECEGYGVGRVKQLEQTKCICTLDTFDSSVSISLPVHELYSLTEESLKMVRSENNRKSIVEAIDESFFKQKFEKMLSLGENKEESLYLQRVPQSLPLSSTQSHSPTPQCHSWCVGDLCVCHWSEDDMYYYARIVKLDSSSCVVSFCFYDNEEEKKFDELHELGSEFELLAVDEENRRSFQQIRDSCTCDNVNNFVVKTKIKQHNGDCNTDVSRGPKRTVPVSLENNKSTSPRPSSKSVNGLPPKPISKNVASKKKSSGDKCNDQPKQREASGNSREHGNPIIDRTCNPEPGKLFTDSLNFPGIPVTTPLIPPSCPDQLFADLKQTPWQAMLISWFMCGYHTGFYEALQKERNNK